MELIEAEESDHSSTTPQRIGDISHECQAKTVSCSTLVELQNSSSFAIEHIFLLITNAFGLNYN